MRSEKLKEYIADEYDEGYCIVAFLDILGFKCLVKEFLNSKTQKKKMKI
jgi:hypothetical protein